MGIDLAARCRAWNADHQHQVQAGKARAKQFTHEHQSQAALAAYRAESVRMRAAHGSPQLFPTDAPKYLTPADIRHFGPPLPLVLQEVILRAYAAGQGWGVDYWLLPPGVDPALPDGTLFGEADPHVWVALAPGFVVCDDCWLVGLCPSCQPNWWADPILARLPQALCAGHGGRVQDGAY